MVTKKANKEEVEAVEDTEEVVETPEAVEEVVDKESKDKKKPLVGKKAMPKKADADQIVEAGEHEMKLRVKYNGNAYKMGYIYNMDSKTATAMKKLGAI